MKIKPYFDDKFLTSLGPKKFIELVNTNGLYCVVNSNTTARVLYADWYLMADNKLLLIARNNSAVIGMYRPFDCLCRLQYQIERLFGCPCEIKNNYQVLGLN